MASIYDEVMSLLPGQYNDSPRLKALLDLLLGKLTADVSVAELEEVYRQLKEDLWLAVATGVNLDRLGKILGCKRGGLSDADYRLRLWVQVGINVSNGRPEQLIDLMVLAYGPTWVQVLECQPNFSVAHQTAKLYLCVKTAAPYTWPDNATDLWQQCAPAGVQLWITSPEDEVPFGFSDDSLADGFDEVDAFHVPEGNGGCFAELIPHDYEV